MEGQLGMEQERRRVFENEIQTQVSCKWPFHSVFSLSWLMTCLTRIKSFLVEVSYSLLPRLVLAPAQALEATVLGGPDM